MTQARARSFSTSCPQSGFYNPKFSFAFPCQCHPGVDKKGCAFPKRAIWPFMILQSDPALAEESLREENG